MYANVMDQQEKMYPTQPPDQKEPEQEEEPTVRSILTSFAESTTMHGLGKVGSPGKGGCSRFIWIMLVLSFFGWAVYNVTLILMNFSSNPISTLVTVRYEDRQPFPAITICNLNQVLHSELYQNEKLKKLKENIQKLEAATEEPGWFFSDDDTPEPSTTSTSFSPLPTNSSRPLGVNTPPGHPANLPPGGNPPANLRSGSNLSEKYPSAVVDRAGRSLSGASRRSGGARDPDRSGSSTPKPNTASSSSTSAPTTQLSTTATTASSLSSPVPKSTMASTAAASSSSPSSSATPSTKTTSTAESSTTSDGYWFEDPDYWSDYSDYHWREGEEEDPVQAEVIEKNEQSKAKIRSFMDQLSPRERFEFGHHMIEMLLECRYQTRARCSHRNFTKFYNHYFGNCFTFNKDESVTSVSKPGPLYGLTLLLNVQSEEYMRQSDTVGFKVLVHPQHAMPFPEDEGIIISPGFTTNIAIKMQEFRRSPPPYEECKYYSEEENRRLNMYALPPYKVHYTEEACQRTCYQRTVVQRCGCCDGDYPCIEHSPAIPAENITFCHDPLEMACMTMVHNDLENSRLGCAEDCIPNCAETTYSSEVSMGLWPPETAIDDLKRKFRHNLDLANFTDVNDFRKNIAKLSIYFKQLNYEKFETFPSYDWYRLLSDLGGQLGLWLGVSLLTAVELLELLCLVVAHLFRKLHQTGHTLVNNGKNNPAHV